eukprot:scaffold19881_cov102-Isochrysis_galbana.AAC.4
MTGHAAHVSGEASMAQRRTRRRVSRRTPGLSCAPDEVYLSGLYRIQSVWGAAMTCEMLIIRACSHSHARPMCWSSSTSSMTTRCPRSHRKSGRSRSPQASSSAGVRSEMLHLVLLSEAASLSRRTRVAELAVAGAGQDHRDTTTAASLLDQVGVGLQ